VINLSREVCRLAVRYGFSPKIFHCSLGWERSREGINSADNVRNHGYLDRFSDYLDRFNGYLDRFNGYFDRFNDYLDRFNDYFDRDNCYLCLVSCGTNKIENSRNRAENRLTRAEAWSSVRFHHNHHLIPKGKNPPALLRAVHVVDADIIPTFICEI
jgi:hypothetical protein